MTLTLALIGAALFLVLVFVAIAKLPDDRHRVPKPEDHDQDS